MVQTRFLARLAAPLLVLAFVAAPAAALEEGTYVPGRLLVKFQPGIDDTLRNAIHGRLGGNVVLRFRLDSDLQLVAFPENVDVRALLERYAALPEVKYVEPDFLYHTQVIPNDARFGSLWGMPNTGQNGGLVDFDIDGPEGWDINTDASQIVIGCIDTGVDPAHEDLSANMWQNPGEIAGNGVDDDANGYVDDVDGWDFLSNDPMAYKGVGPGTTAHFRPRPSRC